MATRHVSETSNGVRVPALMASHTSVRLLLATSVLGFASVGFVSCSGSDATKHAMEDGSGGEGGASDAHPGGGTPPISTGGSKAGSTTGGMSPSAGTAGTSLGGEPSIIPGGGEGGVPSSAGSAALAGAGADTGGAGGDPSAAGGAGGASDACQATAVATRINIEFDTVNAEFVKSLTWRDSTDTLIANVAAHDGVQPCNTVAEFFGQAYGAPEGTTPLVVIGSSRGTATECGADHVITSTPNECNVAQVPTTTEYHFYGGTKASQMRVTRTIGFDANTPKYNGTGLRVWQPRVTLATFPTTIYPNAAETAVTTKTLNGCPGDCLIGTGATWSGRWFADIAANGVAVIVLRDAAMTAPVDLTINYDSNSSSNLSSFVNLQPQDGWKAPITEVQYLCFADLTSWPQTERDAAQLPAFCGP